MASTSRGLFCSTGPYDWLHITGGVEFITTVVVDTDGRLSYEGGYTGTIFATPIDISIMQPVGETFYADVRGAQHGFLSSKSGRVMASDRKMSHESGPQIEVISLRIGENGANRYKGFYKCLDEN